MEMILIFGVLLLLLFTGLPVFISLAVLSTGLLLITGQNLSLVPLSMYASTENFVLLAVPLFMLMAHIMTRGDAGYPDSTEWSDDHLRCGHRYIRG